MVRKLILLSVLCISFIVMSSYRAYGIESRLPVISDVWFSKPLSAKEVLSMTSSRRINIIMVESDFIQGNTPVHEFLVLGAEVNAKNIESTIAENRKASMEDLMRDRKELPKDKVSDLESQFIVTEKSLEAKDTGKILVSKIIISGAKVDVLNFLNYNSGVIQNKSIVTEADYNSISRSENNQESIEELTSLTSGRKKTASVLAVNQPNHATWYPNWGATYTYPSGPDKRYASQYMKWDHNQFAWNETYEHEYRLADMGRRAYLKEGSTSYPGCYPITVYVSTTWPSTSRPYLDTRYNWDKCYEVSWEYSLGAAKASALANNTTYRNYFRTYNGKHCFDYVALLGQRGHRSPSNCYSTWCSFSDLHITFHGWKYVPGSWSFSK